MLISSGFSIYTAYRQFEDKRAEEFAKRLENLRATVLKIADIRSEFLQALATSDQNVTQFSQKSSLLNTKKQVLIENADALLSGVEKDVSPAVFIELAYEEGVDNKFLEAERYYKLGLQSNHVDVVSAVSLRRALGELYLQPQSALYSPDKGRDYFRQALAVVQNQEGDFGLYNRAYVLCDWSYLEFQNKNSEQGRQLLEKGRVEALKISDSNPLRLQAVSLATWTEQFSVSVAKSRAAVPTNLVSGFLGRWRIRYQDDPEKSGALAIAASSDTKTVTANLDVFQSGRLIKKYSGQLYAGDAGMVQIEWTGIEAKPSMGMPWTYINGMTKLKVSGAGRAIGNEYTLGEIARVVKLDRSEN